MADTKHLRLYLIRHGEAEGAAPGKLLGRTNPALSPRGLAQSHELAETMAGVKLSVVYSSDLDRARVTAEIIARRIGARVQEDAAWREVDMGSWEERTIASLHSESPKLISQLFNDPVSFQYPDGESFAAFLARIQKALDHLHQSHECGEVGLVTHGGVCRSIIGRALEIPPRNWLRLAQSYGCLNVLDWYDGKPVLQLFNSKSCPYEERG